MQGLLSRFSALSPVAKARVLTRLVHAETVHARDSYANSAEHEALRRSNEMVHRIAGYICAILDERTSSEQDEAILTMLAETPHLTGQLISLMEQQSDIVG